MSELRTRLSYRSNWVPATRPLIGAQTLGACVVQVGTERITPAAGVLFSVLLRLVHAPDMRLTRDELLVAVWPGQSESKQRGSLRQAIYKLRRLGVSMDVDGELVSLDRAQVIRNFAVERTPEHFDRDVVAGNEPFGVFLPGFVPRGGEFAEWLRDIRDVVHADVRRVLAARLRERRTRADWTGAERMSRWLLHFDPLNEEATLTLAECIALSGSKAQAVEMIDRYLAELGPNAGDIRIPATTLRKRLVDPTPRRVAFVSAEHHFVGREEELAELTLALRRSRWHDGSAFLIHGPPGMGKTRLTCEIAKVATLEGMLQLRFSCRESDSTRPLSLVLELVSELLSSPGALGCAPETLKYLRRLVGEEPVVLTSDGTPAPREPLPSPAAIRRAIADIIAAVSEEKPIFLVVDDVHWLDTQSWDVLVELIERTEATRVCVLLTSRLDHACGQPPARTPLRLVSRALCSLSTTQCESLACTIAAANSTSLDSESTRRLTTLSEGNPLFLESLVQYRIQHEGAEELPPDLLALIQRQLSRLSCHSQILLRATAVLGKLATIPTLQEVLQIDAHLFQSAIGELEQAGLLKMQGRELSCHELIGTSALRVAGEAELTFLSSRCALVTTALLEQTKPTKHLVSACVQLWKNAGEPQELARFVERYAQTMLNLGLPRLVLECCDLCQEDVACPQNLEIVRLAATHEVGLHCRIGEINERISIWGKNKRWNDRIARQVLPQIEHAIRADSLIDRRSAALVAAEIAMADEVRLAHRFQAAEIVLTVAVNIGDSELACSVAPLADVVGEDGDQQVALMYHTIFGDLDSAHLIAVREFERGSMSDDVIGSLRVLERASYALTMCGDQQLATTGFLKCIDVAINHDIPMRAVYPCWRLSLMFLEQADLQQAQVWGTRMRQYLDPSAPGIPYFWGHQARLAIACDDLQEAREYLRRSSAVVSANPWAKALAYQSALELAVCVRSDEPIDPIRVQVAIDRHGQIAQYGTTDFTTFAIAEALATQNRISEAASFIGKYLKIRREKHSLLPALRELCDRLTTRQRLESSSSSKSQKSE